MKETKNEILLAEVKQVQQAVLETYVKYKQTTNDKYLVGDKIDSIDSVKAKINYDNVDLLVNYTGATNESEKYYELDGNDLNAIGIKGSEQTYIVNYFSGEVFNTTTTKTSDGKSLYVQK